MATNAIIAIQHETGEITEIYCHFDGYPDYVGALLNEYYNTPEKIMALMELGDISVLAPSIECPAGHTFETPMEGYTIAYHRDRGEGTKPNVRTHANRLIFKSKCVGKYDYSYLFVDGKWKILQPN